MKIRVGTRDEGFGGGIWCVVGFDNFFFSKKICVYDKILVLLCVSFAKLCSWRTTQKVLSRM